METELDDEILFETRGAIGLVTLNRPKALNALNLAMIEAFTNRLNAWARDRTVHAVVVHGAGDRAFCAGGDIRDLYDRRGTDFGRIYYAAEYTLDTTVRHFPKPYIALMDGVTMGGGAGISVHGSHRIVTERTLFAMPECGIGLFPDIGASWFLNDCPGSIGVFLALTGARLRAADTIYAGIGDNYVPSEALEHLIEALAGAPAPSREDIDRIVSAHACACDEPPLAQERAAIDRCFSKSSVQAIVDSLAQEASHWARAQLETMSRLSPTSLHVAFRQLARGQDLKTFAEVMDMEFRLAAHFYAGHDFFEGVRALIIDKDQSPRWQPASLDEISRADVEAWFAPVAHAPDFDAVIRLIGER